MANIYLSTSRHFHLTNGPLFKTFLVGIEEFLGASS